MPNILFETIQFARHAHRDQRRKYTGGLYAEHLAEVAAIASTAATSYQEMVLISQVAWLHDVIEDQPVTAEELQERFGSEVAQAVVLLSDVEQGPRAVRKQLARERLAAAPALVQTVKVADIISNTGSILIHDKKFASVYLAEAALLLEVLELADLDLLRTAKQQVQQALTTLATQTSAISA